MSSPHRRRWRHSIRLRLTITGTLLAAATFIISGLLVLAIYHHTLVTDQQAALSASAGRIAESAAQQNLPTPIPMPVGATIPRVQVLDASDRVITGDPTSISNPAMLTLKSQQNRYATTIADPPFLPGAHRADVLAIRTTGPAGDRTVVVALNHDPADERTRQAAVVATVVFAVSLVVVAVVAWLTVGRALRPVEHLRSRVETITASGDLTQRAPQPHSADEIARLATTLNRMLGVLHQSDQRQRQFIADAAHELRTPLAGINTFLEVAAAHPATVDRPTLVQQLLTAHRRLNTLVDDLLTLANLDAKAPRRHKPTDLAAILTDCLDHTPDDARRVHADIAGPVIVTGNQAQLGRLITNLLDNALRHAHSQVRVTLSATDTTAVLTIADDGPGVPPGSRERIFERFIRLDPDRNRAQGGTGLGLALVKEITTAHAGTVQVDDTNTGAQFTVTVPLIAPPSSPTDGAPTPPEAPGSSAV
jgi:signal transduction histidine kinase